MRVISDKIRHFRKTFRPPIYYAYGSLIFWLSAALAALILGMTLSDLYLRIALSRPLLSLGAQVSLFLFEVPLLFGMLQVYFAGAVTRYRRLHPSVRRVNLRTASTALFKEKREYLNSTFASFGHNDDLRLLAKSLIDEWEWRRELKLRAQEPLWRRAVGFFGPPSASNFAAYVTGLVAVIAGIVIATMTPDVVFGSFWEFLDDAWSLIRMLWLSIVFPFALCVLPGAIILAGMKNVGETLLEWLDDQYLSRTAFYHFISELLELHDRGERLLLRRTGARLYWLVQLGTAPIPELPGVWRRIKRSKVLGKRFSNT
jgi:hypothetical protein